MPDPTPIQLDIAAFLQKGERRKVIEAFRGVGKSWITSAYVIWRLRLNPNHKFLVVSASKERSDNFTTFCMRLINEIDILKCMIPGKDQRSSKLSFDVALAAPDHSPSVKSVGIFGQLTGTRADEIIADDIETPNNSITQGVRDRLSEAVKEFDAIIKPAGIITYLGTPQTEQSLYNLLPSRGYKIQVWTARYPSKKQIESYGARLAPRILEAIETDTILEGTPTDPRRFSHDDLTERELSYGRSGFALQFMLDTSLSDADRYPLKLYDLIVMGLDKDEAPAKIIWGRSRENFIHELQSVGLGGDGYYAPDYISTTSYLAYTGRLLVIDPSGRGKDETAYSVLYERDGYVFLQEAGGLIGGYSTAVLETLAEIALKHKVNFILIESNFGDGMFSQLLTPVMIAKGVKATLEEVRHNTQKEARIIDTLEPLISSHRLIVDRSVIEKDFISVSSYPADTRHRYLLFYQLTHITKERGALAHDDRLDTLAMGAAYFAESMKQDANVKIKQRENKALEFELQVFYSGIQPKRNKETLMALGFTPNLTAVMEKGNIKTSEYNDRRGGNKDIRNRLRKI